MKKIKEINLDPTENKRIIRERNRALAKEKWRKEHPLIVKPEPKRIKKIKYVSLPVSLVNDLKQLKEDGKLTGKHYQSAIRFISNLQYTSYNTTSLFDEWVHKSYNYLNKLFGPSYKKLFLSTLIEKDIVSCNNYFSRSKNICMQFKVNSKYYISLSDSKEINFKNSVKINFDNSIRVKDKKFTNKEFSYTFNNYLKFESIPYNSFNTYNQQKELLQESNKEFLDKFREDFESLKVDYDKLREIATNKINNLKIEDLTTNEQVQTQFIPKLTQRDKKNSFSYPCTLKKALEKTKTTGMTLVKEKRASYLVNANEYLESKRNSMAQAYFGSIDRLEQGYYNVNRNTTNNRLDTNLTNLSSDLVDEICKENQLVQFDASNSQFAILSYLLSKDSKINQEKDYLLFDELVTNGKLYEELQKEFKLDSRADAKTLMFEVLFSSKSTHKAFRYLRNKFLKVINWIEAYKKAHKSKEFPIMLQKEEAKIFIDQLYLLLKVQGYFCLTKHDSLIVREEDKKEIEKIITHHFAEINFKCNLTTK